MLENDQKHQLVGKWKSDPDDLVAINEYGDVSLYFWPNGALTYTVHTEGKRQIMLLTYRIEGDLLITDQPSDQKEERTRFEIRPDGKMVLLYDLPSRYVRADEIPDSSFSAVINLN